MRKSRLPLQAGSVARNARPDSVRFLIRCDRVKPGDVLLTHGRGGVSKAIARFAGGQFSHAALFWGPMMVFESDTDMTKMSMLKYAGGAIEGDCGWVSLRNVPDEQAMAVAIYRHPSFSTVAEEFDKAVSAEFQTSFGKDYSHFYRLFRIARMPRPIKALAMSISRFIAKKRFKNRIPGLFCSELVARVYRRLGLSLFPDKKSPRDVTPNDLAYSQLQPVEGAVIDLESESHMLRDFYFEREPAIEFDPDAVTELTRDARLSAKRITILQREINAALRGIGKSVRTFLMSAHIKHFTMLLSLQRKISAGRTTYSLPSARAHKRRSAALWHTAFRLSRTFKKLSNDEDSAASEWPKLGASHAAFCKSLVYYYALYECAELKYKSLQCRGWSAGLSRLCLRWKRSRMLRRARRCFPYAYASARR